MPAPYKGIPSAVDEVKQLAEAVNNAIMNTPGNYDSVVQGLGGILDRKLTDFATRENDLAKSETIKDDYRDGLDGLKDTLRHTMNKICGSDTNRGHFLTDAPGMWDTGTTQCAYGPPNVVNNLAFDTISGNLRRVNWGKPKTDVGHLSATNYLAHEDGSPGNIYYAGPRTEFEADIPAGTTVVVLSNNDAGTSSVVPGDNTITIS